jgi:hypothetical protein
VIRSKIQKILIFQTKLKACRLEMPVNEEVMHRISPVPGHVMLGAPTATIGDEDEIGETGGDPTRDPRSVVIPLVKPETLQPLGVPPSQLKQQGDQDSPWWVSLFGVATQFTFQMAALSAKSFATLWRTPLWTVCYVSVPLLTVFALAAASDTINQQVFPPDGGVSLFQGGNRNSNGGGDHLARCRVFNVYRRVDERRSCTTLAWAPTSSAGAAAIMRRVTGASGFSSNDDDGGSVGREDVVGFESAQALGEALLKHPGLIEVRWKRYVFQ